MKKKWLQKFTLEFSTIFYQFYRKLQKKQNKLKLSLFNFVDYFGKWIAICDVKHNSIQWDVASNVQVFPRVKSSDGVLNNFASAHETSLRETRVLKRKYSIHFMLFHPSNILPASTIGSTTVIVSSSKKYKIFTNRVR